MKLHVEQKKEMLYLPMTGDLLPFMVFVLSHGFLGMSGEKKKKAKTTAEIWKTNLSHMTVTKKQTNKSTSSNQAYKTADLLWRRCMKTKINANLDPRRLCWEDACSLLLTLLSPSVQTERWSLFTLTWCATGWHFRGRVDLAFLLLDRQTRFKGQRCVTLRGSQL